MKSVLLLILCNNVGGYMLGNMLGNIGKRKINIKMNLESPVNIVNKFANGRAGIGEPWTIQELSARVDKDNIEGVSLIVKDNVVNGLVAIDKNYNEIIDSNNLHLVRTGIPELTNRVLDILNSHNINYDIFYQPGNFDISSIFQIILNIGFAYLLLSIVGTLITGRGGGGLPGMGPNPLNNKVEVITVDTNISTKFSDVAGCDEAKYELEEVVDFLKNPKKYNDAGAIIPKGILLEGSPGTGKTLLARAVAGEAGVSFISASASEFIEMFVGVGAARVRDLFENAKKNKPCVIFIDEIDAIGRQRGAGLAGGNDEREQTLNQILTNLDGFEKTDDIIVLAATNRADILDNALLRPGRFDRKITVPLPDIVGRKDILKVHLKNKNISKNVNLDELCALTTGFSGADLANLANEAAILSVRTKSEIIEKQNFLDAFEKITIGLPSKKEIRDDEVLKLVSYHEIGHAMLIKIFDEFFDLRKVTINANQGGAGGYTLFTPKERFNNYPTKKFMLANLIVALGGRAAEVVLYENNPKNETDNIFSKYDNLEITTGASNDLKQAEEIAKKYVTLFGLSEDFFISINDNSQPFLGKELAMGGDKTSEYKKEKTDIIINQLIIEAYKIALKLIRLNENEFHLLAKKLIKGKNLDNIEFNKLKFNINIK